MSEAPNRLSNLNSELEQFLCANSRNNSCKTVSLMFRCSYGPYFKLYDSNDHEYLVDETYLSSFREIYTDSRCKNPIIQINF